MQTKATVRYYFIPITLAVKKKKIITSVLFVEDVEKSDLLCIAGGSLDQSLWQTVWWFLRKFNRIIT